MQAFSQNLLHIKHAEFAEAAGEAGMLRVCVLGHTRVTLTTPATWAAVLRPGVFLPKPLAFYKVFSILVRPHPAHLFLGWPPRQTPAHCIEDKPRVWGDCVGRWRNEAVLVGRRRPPPPQRPAHLHCLLSRCSRWHATQQPCDEVVCGCVSFCVC